MSVLLNSPCISHLFSQLIYDGEHVYLTYFVYAHYLSVFFRRWTINVQCIWAVFSMQCIWALCWRSSPLADDVSSHINSPGISHLSSQFISDGKHLFFDTSHLHVFVYAHYYLLLSVCILQDAQMFLYSWQDVPQSRALCWRSSPLADDVSGHVNSPVISHSFSQLIFDWWWAFILWHISPILFMLSSSICLYIVRCMNGLTLFARRSSYLRFLF